MASTTDDIVEMKNQQQRPNDCTYWVAPNLLAGEYPAAATPDATRHKLGRYLDCGIQTFVDLTCPGEKPRYVEILQQEAKARGIVVQYHRMAIPDFGIPDSHGTMKDILDVIDDSMAAGGVYVHCRGGIGRTGTTVGCWLVRNTKRSGEQALEETNRLFRTFSERSKESAYSPETRDQMNFVRMWKEI